MKDWVVGFSWTAGLRGYWKGGALVERLGGFLSEVGFYSFLVVRVGLMVAYVFLLFEPVSGCVSFSLVMLLGMLCSKLCFFGFQTL